MNKEEFIENQKSKKISFISLLKILNKREFISIISLLFLSFFSIFFEFLSISSIPIIFSNLLNFESQVEIINKIFLILENNALNNINSIIFLIILIFFLRSLFLYLTKILDFIVYKRIRLRISSDLINKYLNTSLAEIQLDTAATKIWKLEIVASFTSVIDNIVNLIRNAIYGFSILIFLSIFVTKNIIFFFVPIVLIVLFFYIIFTNLIKNTGKFSDLGRNLKINSIQNIINGIRDIIIFKKHNFFNQKFNQGNIQLESFLQRNTVITNIPIHFIEFIGVLFICLFFIKYNDVSQSTENTLTALSVLAYGGIRLISIFKISLSHFNSYKKNNFILITIKDELEKEIKKINLDKIYYKKNNDLKTIIEIKDLHFFYKDKSILADINFTFEKNKLYALIGESGSGKSTLLDLILGLKEIRKGNIIVNCNRSEIGYVSQESYLIEGTIKSNIAFGIDEKNIDEGRLIKAAKEAEIYEFISSSKKGFDSEISIFGSNISVGQKQRIGIARALYYNTKILLLDEPTSSLDINTEKNFLKTLEKLKKNRTIIMSTHKTNLEEHIDKTLIIENKSIYDKEKFQV
tara:strand:- start:32 stop:1765 length:1734 start_codon:yes stop_codon:yes gene_type:complete